MKKVGRIKSNGDLEAARELHEMWPAFDEEAEINDNHELDDNYEFDDEDGIEKFFSYLFGIPVEWDNVDRIARIDEKGDIITPELNETENKLKIDNQKNININGELKEGVDL